jgi:hypothetical protein
MGGSGFDRGRSRRRTHPHDALSQLGATTAAITGPEKSNKLVSLSAAGANIANWVSTGKLVGLRESQGKMGLGTLNAGMCHRGI